ncbi:flagella synthesis protein FlgN [Aliidiomarina sp. Khilg15.8]
MAPQLSELMDQQAAQLQQLIAVQAEEKELLIKRDAPALDDLTQRKEKLLDQIQSTDRALAEHPEKDSIETIPPLRQKRVDIQALMQTCQANNDVNGQLVRQTLGRIHHMKQTMQAAKSGTAITYTSKGKTSTGASGNSIKA